MASEQIQPQDANNSSSSSTIEVTEPSAPNGVQNIFEDILEWSKERPGWQRDALRRLFTSGKLSSKDLDDLVELSKSGHGLGDPRRPDPLATEHIAVTSRQAVPVSLTAITHHQGVNALAPNQTVAFGPNLTIVYGANAAGKSGYTRVLKRACRSRGLENILGNVLSGEPPTKQHATIRYREGGAEIPLEWGPDTPASAALANVSVFDSHCAAVYLKDKTDVAFRPFGLDIFDMLSVSCGEVRERLENELSKITKIDPTIPNLPEGTRARALVDGLTVLSDVDELRKLATLSDAEEQRIVNLRELRKDFLSADPKQRARELKLKADRYGLVVQHLDQISAALSNASLSELQRNGEAVRVARQALLTLQRGAISPDLLPGTGSEAWRSMWEAVSHFSDQAYPASSFPVLAKGARCPFCQQLVEEETADRLKHFAEYVSSAAQSDLR